MKEKETKICQNCKQDFTIEPDDFGFYEKIKVPPPTFCPECRVQRRMAWRNERTLHRNKCAMTGKNVVSCFSKDSPFTVYERDIWWSDKWDPLEYGQEYDFSRPFFEQFRKLLEKVPLPNLFIGKCVNTFFLYDCKNCINCFGCTNLRNKSNCMWNEQLTKEEYDKRLKELDIGSVKNLEKAKQKFEALRLKALRRFANILNSKDVSGDNIIHANNCYYCFDIAEDMKDCKYIMNSATQLYTSYDGYGVGANTELLYEAMDSGINGSRQLFGLTLWECLNAEYSFNCHGCNNIFGCVNLRKKEYCIFNKQYSKEEFEKLRVRIIEHMTKMPYEDKRGRLYFYGEYFPAEISPFGYNETVAQDYFPLSKEQILENGYNWIEREKPEYSATCKSQDLPDHIKDIDETILRKVIECKLCKRVYKIIEDEYKFLRKFNLPVPHNCFECRHQERFKLVNFPRLYSRKCMCTKKHPHHNGKCEVKFETSYAPNRPEIVYCEKCYQQEVY